MSRHKVSRGNTSELIGLWNNRTSVTSMSSTIEAKPNHFLSVNPAVKLRKTSAFVPSTTISEEKNEVVKNIRKTSAMVLMPTGHSRDKSPTIVSRSSLNVDDRYNPPDFKPLKNVSGLDQPIADQLPKLRSALKLSTVQQQPPKIKTENILDANNNNSSSSRRGSVGLGRSKSVCHKVKFVPVTDQDTDSSNQGHGRSKNSSFAMFQKMDNTTATTTSTLSPRLTRQASLPSLNDQKVKAPAPVGQQKADGNGGGGGLRRSTVVARSPSSAKEVILSWVQERTNTYPNLNVTNFSSSWNDGMAFCALIHYYYPEAFDYDKLNPKNRRHNFDLAFRMAEQYADICPLLDVEDMVMYEKPDWKCVFTYVQTFFRRFRNGRDPPTPTKKLTLTPPTAPNIHLATKSIE